MNDGVETRANYKTPRIVFSREITLGHLLQMVTILGAGVFFALRLEARIDVNDVRITNVERRLESNVADIKSSLNRIENKLDQKADK